MQDRLNHEIYSGDPQIRAGALRELKDIQELWVLPVLIEKLTDPAANIQKMADRFLKAYPGRQEVIEAYLEVLPAADPELALILLQKIEKQGQDIPELSCRLLPFLHHPDYRVRLRTFIALGRLKDPSPAPELVEYLKKEQKEEWQLVALECLAHLQERKVVGQLAPFLNYHQYPLVVRGVVWLIGSLGGREAVEIIAGFTASPQGRLVKSELILEALALAITSFTGGPDCWEKVKAECPDVERAFRYTIFPDVDQVHFGIYPYPDYLLDRAREQGISHREFKKLYFWDRDN